MKIKTRVLLTLCTLPIFLVILIIIGSVQIKHFNNITDDIQVNYDLSISAEIIQTEIKDTAISLRNLLIFSDENNLQAEIVKVKVNTDQITKNIALLENRAYTAEQKQLIEELTILHHEYIVYRDTFIRYLTDGKINEATALMNDTSSDIHGEFFELITTMTESFESNMYEVLEQNKKAFTREIIIEILVLVLAIVLITFLLYRNIQTITSRLSNVSAIMSSIASGKKEIDTKIEVHAHDEIGEMVHSFNQMTTSLSEQKKVEEDLVWRKTHIAGITTSISGAKTIEELAETFLSTIVPLIEGSHAVFYVREGDKEGKDPIYKIRATYAFKERKHMTNEFQAGEGLIGQAVLEKRPIILSNVPSDYVSIKSGLGEATPLNLYVLPILFEDEVKGIFEIASFHAFTENQQAILEELIDDLGIILDSVMGRIKLAELLEETQMLMEEIQAQSEELQTQQDELKATNEELEQQTLTLRQSEEQLQMQQEELEQTNAELEEKAYSLSKQNKEFELKNAELEKARVELEDNAKKLALSSKYKSQFLANMSHELRTPLNSMLILSELLSDNKDKTLSAKQIEFAKTIHASGKELLKLINDILDLSKIESGKMEVQLSDVRLKDIEVYIENNFRPLANNKKLQFTIQVEDDVPETIYTDQTKIQQILNNLLSNAFKFTNKGEVLLTIGVDKTEVDQPKFTFTVMDTGIGISEEHLQLIFDAFQQVDGTTSRRYEGTGLGLSISKELATLLNGNITVNSVEEEGTTFTLALENYEEEMTTDVQQDLISGIKEVASTVEINAHEHIEPTFSEDFTHLRSNPYIKRVLIVDSDQTHRNHLMELIGEMDVVLKAVSTSTDALQELKRQSFDCIILNADSDLFALDALNEIEAKDQLKLLIITGRELNEREKKTLNKFTQCTFIKDIHSTRLIKDELKLFFNDSPPLLDSSDAKDSGLPSELVGKKVLIVDDDVRNVFALSSILELYGMDIRFAENGVEALQLLEEDVHPDLIIMDIMMPEMDGYETIRHVRDIPKFKDIPIITLTAKAMKEDREMSLEAGASDYIMKPVDTDQLLSLIKVWLFTVEGKQLKNE